ncbi:hypothetical protein [Bailinhaonella thermotolerans]|uniref:Uncharacterized protein n=1 Tax=Bailinhaonella thermotolerans TaxID=1070861 RepID=A0A3A4A7W7_9ACTN|nr:hypothetical protein [Bailinhaonella thermotolerans]RJL24131.1 hypothetical protein D5H75_30220 [Bailinhaonella thermotolerans]
MVWGGFDPFTTAESDTHAMVAAPWWPGAPPEMRRRAVEQRVLALPDGSLWLFGALARWYRCHPYDGGWYLCPPPASAATRASAGPARRRIPQIPMLIVPTGPDFAYDRGSHLGFVGPDVPGPLTDRVRALLVANARDEHDDRPLSWPIFAPGTPSSVAAIWATIMWCSYSPVFDGNEVLLSMFGEFLDKPLPGDEWVRWLPPFPLATLVALYAERVRAGRTETGLRLVSLVTETAATLRADPRFGPRAEALLAMAGPVLARPDLDYAWIPHGDAAVAHAWLARCPPHLAPATLAETAPGEHFRHTLYDFARSLAYVDADRPGGVEPRVIAATLVAADVAATRPDLAGQIAMWLDPELAPVLNEVVRQPRHPLRGYWPSEDGLPAWVRPPDAGVAAGVLGAGYAADLAWCRLTGASVPATGFPTPCGLIHQLTQEPDKDLNATSSPHDLFDN